MSWGQCIFTGHHRTATLNTHAVITLPRQNTKCGLIPLSLLSYIDAVLLGGVPEFCQETILGIWRSVLDGRETFNPQIRQTLSTSVSSRLAARGDQCRRPAVFVCLPVHRFHHLHDLLFSQCRICFGTLDVGTKVHNESEQTQTQSTLTLHFLNSDVHTLLARNYIRNSVLIKFGLFTCLGFIGQRSQFLFNIVIYELTPSCEKVKHKVAQENISENTRGLTQNKLKEFHNFPVSRISSKIADFA